MTRARHYGIWSMYFLYPNLESVEVSGYSSMLYMSRISCVIESQNFKRCKSPSSRTGSGILSSSFGDMVNNLIVSLLTNCTQNSNPQHIRCIGSGKSRIFSHPRPSAAQHMDFKIHSLVIPHSYTRFMELTSYSSMSASPFIIKGITRAVRWCSAHCTL